MKATLRVLAIGFSWMLIWGVTAFCVVVMTADQRVYFAVNAVAGVTLLAAGVGLLLGLVYRLVIEIFAAKEEELRRLRSDIILGTLLFVVLLLALALTSHVKKRIESRPEMQKAASVMRPFTPSIRYQILTR